MDRFAQLLGVGRHIIGEEFAEPLARQQALRRQRFEQQVPVAAALRCFRCRRSLVGIDPELVPPFDVAPEPKAFQRRQIVRRSRGGGQGRVVPRWHETGVAAAFEDSDPIR